MCLFLAPAAAAGAAAATTATTAMAAASLAAAAIGAGVTAYSQWQKGKQEKAYYEAQAKIARNNQKMANAQAEDAIKRGGEADIELRRQYAQKRGAQVAGLAASGVALDEGSALSVLQDTDMFEQIDSGRTRDNAQREAWGYRVQGTNYSNDATMARMAGRNASGAVPYAVGGTLLSTATDVSDRWLKFRNAGAF